MKLRIVEQEYPDGTIKYVLEQEKHAMNEFGTEAYWESIFRSDDLEAVREGKRNREARVMIKSRVIE